MPIEVRNLKYTYSPKTPFAKVAIEDITLTINSGDYIGIIGHTGSGKSTFLQHLNGLIKLQEGYIKVGEIELGKKYDYKKLRSTVGMVFQYPEYQLFDSTVERDVGFGPRNLKLAADDIQVRVRSAIAAVGLEYNEIAQQSPFEISGGQKRRAALAGVIAMRPTILVLDEPTAGLDPVGKSEVLRLIDDLKENAADTVIMVSHHMDEVAEHCNRIIVFDKGHILYDMQPSELFCHREALQAIGLEVPEAVYIRDALNKRGWNLPTSLYKEKDIVRAIAQVKGAKV